MLCKLTIFTGIAVVILSLFMSQGCSTLPNGRGWGQDATITPGWRKIGNAAVNAAVAPEFWAPLAGALVLQVDDMDKRLSNWGSKHTPLFGSNHAANDASGFFNSAAEYTYYITLLATPSGDKPESWALAKLKGFAVETVAISASNTTTDRLKNTINRKRPDGSDYQSFPSGTTSHASVSATLASHNLDSININDGMRSAMKYFCFTLTALTAWSRVEAKKHYPSDVLAGASLGYFSGTFFNNAFMGLQGTNDVSLALEPVEDGFMVKLLWSF